MHVRFHEDIERQCVSVLNQLGQGRIESGQTGQSLDFGQSGQNRSEAFPIPLVEVEGFAEEYSGLIEVVLRFGRGFHQCCFQVGQQLFFNLFIQVGGDAGRHPIRVNRGGLLPSTIHIPVQIILYPRCFILCHEIIPPFAVQWETRTVRLS